MTSPVKILVVDDEPPIRRLLRTSLSAQGYRVVEAASGREAVEQLGGEKPDLVVLDLGLPDRDGLDVIREMRRSSHVPIVVLTSRTDERGKVEALDLGADDHVTKPFGIEELSARIRTALRHRFQEQGRQPVFRNGNLTVDLVARRVTVCGQDVKLTRREYDLLQLLATHTGKVLTHKFILDHVWGEPTDVQQLRIYIRALRQKLEAEPERPRLILTETGVGYRLRAQD